MMKKTVTLILLIFSISVFQVSCVSDKYYRTIVNDDTVNCEDFYLGNSNRESHDDQKFKCALQQHTISTENLWRSEPDGNLIKEPNNFSLAFVEMSENGKGTEETQLIALKQHLDSKEQNYVISYTHGWRHNADITDTDAQKFRVLLSYARSFLNSRCVEKRRYCNTSLTGVFIGWHGKSFSEQSGTFVDTPIAATTLWARKKHSERLAIGPKAKLGNVFSKIQSSLHLNPNSYSADKFLITGHSLGGNMLATYLEPKVLDAVNNHSPGTIMEPLLGDLVVLINPASEASKWTSFQKRIREKSGLSQDDIWGSGDHYDGVPPDDRKNVNNWKKFFSPKQRPIYISLTSSKDWNKIELKGRRKPEYDSATANLFPLAKKVTLKLDREETTAIGHLMPLYGKDRKIKAYPYGTTHDFIVNAGANSDTNFANSTIPSKSWCKTVDGWLSKAQKKIKPNKYGEHWDWGLNDDYTPMRNVGGDKNDSGIQIRHPMYPKQGRVNSPAAGYSAFWNMRALDLAITEHNGFQNYPTWCGINQMVLDNITAD